MFVFGLILTIALVVRKVKGAILIGIVASTILSVILEFTLHIGPSFDGKNLQPAGLVPRGPDVLRMGGPGPVPDRPGQPLRRL